MTTRRSAATAAVTSTSQPRGATRNGSLSYAIFTLARAHRAYAAGMLRDRGLHPGRNCC